MDQPLQGRAGWWDSCSLRGCSTSSGKKPLISLEVGLIRCWYYFTGAGCVTDLQNRFLCYMDLNPSDLSHHGALGFAPGLGARSPRRRSGGWLLWADGEVLLTAAYLNCCGYPRGPFIWQRYKTIPRPPTVHFCHTACCYVMYVGWISEHSERVQTWFLCFGFFIVSATLSTYFVFSLSKKITPA